MTNLRIINIKNVFEVGHSIKGIYYFKWISWIQFLFTWLLVLSVNSFHLKNFWSTYCAYACSLHIVRCENTYIHDVSIYGDFNTPNNDGIDIEDSNHTVITRCHIDTGDDAICPKTYTGGLHNLTATNCWIRTKSSAIKLGSASWFGFKNLIFDNITIVDSHRGLALQIRDGGNFLGFF